MFPTILLLSILIAFLKFIVSVSGIILGILSFLLVLGSIATFIQKDITTFIRVPVGTAARATVLLNQKAFLERYARQHRGILFM